MPRPRQEPSPPVLQLTQPRVAVRGQLDAQHRLGESLLKIEIVDKQTLEDAIAARSRWIKFVTELLKQLFTNTSLADEFRRRSIEGSVLATTRMLHEATAAFNGDIRKRLLTLQSIIDRVTIIPQNLGVQWNAERDAPALRSPMPARSRNGRDVFVVHGSNETMRSAVCMLLSSVGLNPIVLHEQANRGRTLIEKFEAHSDVSFAIVLLTADDVGARKTEEGSLRLRARQNVVLELGYFIAKIGRERVCALYEDGVEIPSDINGFLYVPLKPGWHTEVIRELQAARIEIDTSSPLVMPI